ncbi:MAG: hypothetical protein KBS61_05505 [Chryseobacterium sp.]|nr:hypothetical protein [Candidatus Chryseobacterium enterohippi]
MKKNILSLAVLALGFSAAYAQTGNVGINTSTPSETLHIKGTFKLEDPGPNPAAAGYVLTSTSTGIGQWKPLPSTASPAVSSLTTNGTSGAATLVSGTLNIPNYTYTLPIATTTLGGVKNGGNVTINSDGTMSAPVGSTGTVTNFSAGDLAPLFTTTETNTSTTPALSFALTSASAGTIFGNNTGATAAPAYFSASSLPLAGDVTGTLGANKVVKIQNVNVSATAPTAGQVLQYNTSNGQYEPTSLPAASNDWALTGNATTSGAAALGSTSTNYVGTTDAKSLALATSGTTKAVLGTDGSLKGGGGTLNSLTWGTNTTGATGTNSIALGNNNTASGVSTLALGDSNTSSGANSFTLGKSNSATSDLSFSIGFDSNGTANTNTATTSGNIGFGNTVSGVKNFVYGSNNVVSGVGTGIQFKGGGYVFGSNNTVQGSNSLVLGYNNKTASASFVFGYDNTNITGGTTLGSVNTANSGVVLIGDSNDVTGTNTTSVVIGSNIKTATLTATNYFGNTYQVFNNGNNLNTTKVAINVPTDSATADLTVKETIKIMPSTGITTLPLATSKCTSTTVGTIIYDETGTTGTFYGCKRTGALTYAWQSL